MASLRHAPGTLTPMYTSTARSTATCTRREADARAWKAAIGLRPVEVPSGAPGLQPWINAFSALEKLTLQRNLLKEVPWVSASEYRILAATQCLGAQQMSRPMHLGPSGVLLN